MKRFVVVKAGKSVTLLERDECVTTEPRCSRDGKRAIVGVATAAAKWNGEPTLSRAEAQALVRGPDWDLVDWVSPEPAPPESGGPGKGKGKTK